LDAGAGTAEAAAWMAAVAETGVKIGGAAGREAWARVLAVTERGGSAGIAGRGNGFWERTGAGSRTGGRSARADCAAGTTLWIGGNEDAGLDASELSAR
jgi:hypothetical protein